MAGKLMRYPADIIDASTDYFKIEILKNIKPSPKPDNHNSIIMLEEFKDNDRVCFLKKTDSHYSMFFLDEVYDPSNHQFRFTFNPETRGPLVFIKPTQLPRAKNIVDAEG